MPSPRCRRIGCTRPRLARTEQRGPRPWCGTWCRKFDCAFTAFAQGGAALDRDADTDALLFAGILALGVMDPRSKATLNELWNAYGKAI